MHPRRGAVCHGQRTNGRWSDDEHSQHIDVLELKAAFPGPKLLSEEPISQGGVLENGQHYGNSPHKQQGWYPVKFPQSTNIVNLEMVPGEEQ